MASEELIATTGVAPRGTGKILPLNSKRLTKSHLKSIAHGLGAPATGSREQLAVVVSGRLQERDKEPANVQVKLVVGEVESEGETGHVVKLQLIDQGEVFAEIDPYQPEEPATLTVVDDTKSHSSESDSSEDETGLVEEVARLKEELAEVTTLKDSKSEEATRLKEELAEVVMLKDSKIENLENQIRETNERLASLERALSKEKDKLKGVWRMNCEQLAACDEELTSKDAEIAQLRTRLTSSTPPPRRPLDPAASEFVPGTPTAVLPSHSEVSGLLTPLSHRRRSGKAPPVDPFSGETAELRFEDWLPSLERAATWNNWSEEEKLMQLAGYLRGKALQEWNLLDDTDKSTYQKAVAKITTVLGPGSRVMAAQDFRHTLQEEAESVSSYIRRLERAFRLAHGSDKLDTESRSIFLFTQMQDGLRQDLMRSPSVSGALSYSELCMAAKNEEKRLIELRKRQQFKQHASKQSTSHSQAPKKGGNPRYENTSGGSHRFATRERIDPKTARCNMCGEIGHFQRDCKMSKSESRGKTEGRGKPENRSGKKASTKLVTIRESPSQSEVQACDPRDLLHSDSDNEANCGMVLVADKGGRTQRAKVLVQGVPTDGVVDTGAEITIIGGDLFRKVAAANRLKKNEFKSPDKTPRTYDGQVFSLDGRITLDVCFGDKTMKTVVYVKMDATEQLLLGEGVCRQLGIVTYHPDVIVTGKSEKSVARVPMVSVRLLNSVKVPPMQSICVQVQAPNVNGHCMIEPDPSIHSVDGLQLTPTLANFSDGITGIVLSNHSGFTCEIEEGRKLGNIEDVEPVCEPQKLSAPDVKAKVRQLLTQTSMAERKQKLCELCCNDQDLPPDVQKQLVTLLEKYHDCFSLSETERGQTDLVQFEIETGDAAPCKQRPRRMPFAVREEVSRQLRKMQEAGVIQPSKSPWSSPIVLVRKRDGTHRFCVDYRQLNAVTKTDTFPLPRIDDLLDQLGSAQYFSTLDLSSGYWQIAMHPNSQEKTAFATHEGLHEFCVMPFGLKNAPAAFQRLMQQVLMGLNPTDGIPFVSVYIDDVIIFSHTLADHIHHLEMVLKRLAEVNLKLKPVKCRFFCKAVEYLGYRITNAGLETSKRHVDAVKQFPQPTDVKGVRRFLGLASYYRRFVRSFAKLAQPLHVLTRKDVAFHWSDECQRAFDTLKDHLTKAPILVYPNFKLRFYLETDASVQGLGCVLSQKQDDKRLHPVAYASRALSPGERNYAITELETLAVVWAVTHFRAYLYGSDVTIYTDHSAVKSVLLDPHAVGKHAQESLTVESKKLRYCIVQEERMPVQMPSQGTPINLLQSKVLLNRKHR